ncbi:MAG TPA: DUF5667 domain-containing protein [Candidatus Paceibacterota bacterium]|jgi:hypothetical protein|nr:DUF5667 domain-containing protein [Candidatus Paceibacterota bacterium]
MDNEFNTIKDSINNLTLTKKERALILEKVNSFMKENPLNSNGVISPYSKDVMAKPLASHIWYSNLESRLFKPLSKLRRNKYMPIILLLMLMVGGGTSIAANHALPGDVLYPIKIHVNEKVESMFAFGANANAKVEAEQANKRLQETEQLSASGSISVEAKDQIKTNFDQHANKVKEFVADIKTKGDASAADSVNSKFESSLQAHQAVLTELSKNDPKDKEKIDEINGDVGAHLLSSAKEGDTDKNNTEKDSNQNNLNLNINSGTQINVSHDSNNTSGAVNTNNSVHLGL